jgi:quinol monooxygenase YgiN
MSMIIERVGIAVSPEKREDLRRALASLVEPISVEPGCLNCELYQLADNINRFSFEARWKTDRELVRHLRSELYRNLLMIIELGKEPPVIEFHEVAATKGLEFIQAVRREIFGK